MKAKVIVNNIALDPPQVSEYTVNVNDSMTIQELLDEIDCGWADLSDYYPMSGTFTRNEPLFPYLITDGKVLYDVEFKSAKVQDFLYTHNIGDHTRYDWLSVGRRTRFFTFSRDMEKCIFCP